MIGVGIRDVDRRLRGLEQRRALAYDYTPEQWARLSDADLHAMTKLRVRADGTWDEDRWIDEQHEFADAVYSKAMGAEA